MWPASEILTTDYYRAVDATGNWPDVVRLIYEESCVTAVMAYAAIALSLLICSSLEHCNTCHVIVSVRSRIVTSRVLVILLTLFALTQLENVVSFYYPMYTLFSLLQFANAVTAWIAAWLLLKTRCKTLFRL